MRYTNLDYVQAILSAMDSDEVNSVSDTAESLQVLTVLRTSYFDLATTGMLPRDFDLFSLTASGDNTLPVTMYLPDTAESIEWLKYNYATTTQTQTNYQILKPMDLDEFITLATNMDPTQTNVTSYLYNGFTLYCRNDVAPQYYTSANDNTILFDSFDSTVDTTLQSSKIMAYGQKAFPWSDADTFVPPLDDKQSQQLLHMAKSLAFAELKQQQHAKAEHSARQIEVEQQSDKYKVLPQTYWNTTYDFGRRPMGKTKPTGRYK